MFAAVCAAHYFLKNKQARSEKALEKGSCQGMEPDKRKSRRDEKRSGVFKNGFKVQTEEYITSYDYRNVNTVIASKDTLVVSGRKVSFFRLPLMGKLRQTGITK